MARPTKYSAALGERICEQIATKARGLIYLCEHDETFPSAASVYRWLRSHQEFREAYATAREMQGDLLFDEIIEIADDGTRDTVESAKGPMVNREWIQRSQLRCAMRQWAAGKLRPKLYGSKAEVAMVPGDGLMDLLLEVRGGEKS